MMDAKKVRRRASGVAVGLVVAAGAGGAAAALPAAAAANVVLHSHAVGANKKKAPPQKKAAAAPLTKAQVEQIVAQYLAAHPAAAGATGPAGPTGLTGPAGPTGPTGASGTDYGIGKGLGLNSGTLSVADGDGLTFDTNNKLELNPGPGLEFNPSGQVQVDSGTGIGIDYSNNQFGVNIGPGLEADSSNLVQLAPGLLSSCPSSEVVTALSSSGLGCNYGTEAGIVDGGFADATSDSPQIALSPAGTLTTLASTADESAQAASYYISADVEFRNPGSTLTDDVCEVVNTTTENVLRTQTVTVPGGYYSSLSMQVYAPATATGNRFALECEDPTGNSNAEGTLVDIPFGD